MRGRTFQTKEKANNTKVLRQIGAEIYVVIFLIPVKAPLNYFLPDKFSINHFLIL